MAIEHSGIAITADVVKSKLLDMSVTGNEDTTESAFYTRWRQHVNQKPKPFNKTVNSFKDGEMLNVHHVHQVLS